ncbi:MAG: cysteine hydrolase [Clostridiales Family XIII bacterium]|jgi:nicotinamidase-related amidase|nr:cysteine hydrolase [Clostridiales Family XIII bacterium]
MKALLIIDIQNDYFPGWANEQVGALAALANAESALRLFRERNLPVIHLQHLNLPEASFFKPGTEGAEIREELKPIEGETHIVKYFPNGFMGTGLEELLLKEGIGELAVCGMMTHMCVDTTVRAAKERSIEITLLSDACATKDLSFDGVEVPAAQVQAAYLSALGTAFATVIKTGELAL